jgi:hypothetical protein
MAGDSFGTFDNLLGATKHKKVWRDEATGCLVGYAGRVFDLPALEAVALGRPGAEMPAGDDVDGEVLVVWPDGRAELTSTVGNRCEPVDLPFSIGSGSLIALGAMLFGASPEGAVSVAAMRDVKTGGEITVVRFD